MRRLICKRICDCKLQNLGIRHKAGCAGKCTMGGAGRKCLYEQQKKEILFLSLELIYLVLCFDFIDTGSKYAIAI